MIDTLLSVVDRLIQLKTHRDDRLKETFADLLEPIFNDLLIIHRDYIEIFENSKRLLPNFSSIESYSLHDLTSKERTFMLFGSAKDAERYSCAPGMETSSAWKTRSEITHFVELNFYRNSAPLYIGFSKLGNAEAYCRNKGIEIKLIRVAEKVLVTDEECKSMLAARNYVAEARLKFEPVRVSFKALTQNLLSMTLNTQANEFVVDILDYFPIGTFEARCRTSAATNLLNVLDEYLLDTDRDNAHRAYKYVCDASSVIGMMERDSRHKWAKVCESFATLKISVVGRF